MSIFSFSSIMTKIFHQGSSSSGRSSVGRSGQQVARASGQTVDGEAVLSGMEANAGQKLDLDNVIGSVTGSGQGSSKFHLADGQSALAASRGQSGVQPHERHLGQP
jgi:hypothetical protein